MTVGMTSPEERSKQADKIVAAWKKIVGLRIDKRHVEENLKALEKWKMSRGDAQEVEPLLRESENK